MPEIVVDRLLSTKHICEALDVSDRGLRRWVSSGKFPSHDVKIGTSLRWKTATLVDFIAREAQPEQPRSRKPIRFALRVETRTG